MSNKIQIHSGVGFLGCAGFPFIVRKHGTGYSKLPTDVNASVHVCLSLCFSPVIGDLPRK